MSSPMGSFGVELEYSIVRHDGSLALGSAPGIANVARREGLSAVPELGSFQIELNPGPWEYSEVGIAAAIDQLRYAEERLRTIVEALDYRLVPCAIVPSLDESQIRSPDFFAKSPRFAATSGHFAARSARVRLSDGTDLALPGESAIACINEIHVHIQLRSDEHTLALFNVLNAAGHSLAAEYLVPLTVNQRSVEPSCTTMVLFEAANGERSVDGSLKRVGFIPEKVLSLTHYENLARSFPPIQAEGGKILDPMSTVYFWVRLHGAVGSLRLEYRPIDMSPQWDTTLARFLSRVHSMIEDSIVRMGHE